MPPKFKFTKTEIIEASFERVRNGGWKALSTRSVAETLGSSARPIYSFFKSMTELEEEVVKKAVDLLYSYMIKKRTGDPWYDHGIGYVMFGLKEKFLFRGLNDEKHIQWFRKYGEIIWDQLTASLVEYPFFKGLSEERIYKIQFMRWLFTHGLAFQACNQPPGVFNEENITALVKEGSMALFDGLEIQRNLKSR